MRSVSLAPILALALLATPVHADDPACLLFHPTVPNGSYSGFAALPGGPGGVLDRCSTFGAANAWQLSNTGPGTGPSIAPETVTLNAPQTGFGFWTGVKAELWLRFFLGDEEQYATGWFTTMPSAGPRWDWGGTFDRVEIGGAYVLMLYGLDPVPEDIVEPLLEPDEEEDFPGLNDFVVRLGDGDPEWQEEQIASTVPEPATLTLLASGLVGMAGAARRKRGARQLAS
jgi:hypothetical protein